MLHIKKKPNFLKNCFYFFCKSSLTMSDNVFLSDGFQVVPLESILVKQWTFITIKLFDE